MSRWLAYGVGLTAVVVVALPGFGDPSRDSYPLSTYPMFARARDKPQLYFVEGLDAAGTPLRLEPELVANQEVMQAAATVRRAVRSGPEATDRLCKRVAERVAASAAHTPIVRVRIVGARFDPLRYFLHGPEPEERSEHARCRVVRRR